MIAFLAVLALIFSVLFNVIFVWYLYKLKQYNVPGPTPLPIIGNTLDFGYKVEDIQTNILKFVNDNVKKYNGFFKLFIGPKMVIVGGKPEVMKYILSSTVHLSKTDLYDILKPVLGDGLATSTGLKWKKHRRIVEPALHFNVLEKFVKVMRSTTDVFAEIIQRKADENNGVIDHFENLSKLFALDVICETAMGTNIGALNSSSSSFSDYAKSVETFYNIMVERWFSGWMRNDYLFKLSPKYKTFWTAVDNVNSLARKIIKKKRDTRPKSIDEIKEDDVGIKQRKALIDLLLETEEGNLLTDQEVQDELNTAMLAGHETTSTSIAFAIYELSQNQDVQEKLYEEISETFDAEEPSVKNIMAIKYLDMVVKETLRKYPAVPFIERALDTDAEIEGIKFKKGTAFMLPIYSMHYMEEQWPEPNKFDPLRFLPENSEKRHNFAFLPFSAGPRNCVGQKFALLEIKIALAEILRNFKILPCPEHKPIVGMTSTLKAVNGIKIRVQRRLKE